MPILPAEPDLYPQDLWEVHDRLPVVSREADEDSPRQWWCLHTKPRQEKATARELRAQKVSYYLPQVVREDRTPQGRKTRSIIPLFTSYLFLWGDDRDRVTALKGNRLVRVIDVTDQSALNRDLKQVHQMLASGLVVVPEPTVPVGAQVRIVSGPLAGIEGRVIRRGKLDQFVAVVHFLGSGATVNLEDWQVEQVVEEKA